MNTMMALAGMNHNQSYNHNNHGSGQIAAAVAIRKPHASLFILYSFAAVNTTHGINYCHHSLVAAHYKSF
jgi:hypothetical protein